MKTISMIPSYKIFLSTDDLFTKNVDIWFSFSSENTKPTEIKNIFKHDIKCGTNLLASSSSKLRVDLYSD